MCSAPFAYICLVKVMGVWGSGYRHLFIWGYICGAVYMIRVLGSFSRSLGYWRDFFTFVPMREQFSRQKNKISW